MLFYWTSTFFLLGQERPANTGIDGKIALLIADVVLIATQTTRGQALGIVRRAGVEPAGGTLQGILQAEDASRAAGCSRAG